MCLLMHLEVKLSRQTVVADVRLAIFLKCKACYFLGTAVSVVLMFAEKDPLPPSQQR